MPKIVPPLTDRLVQTMPNGTKKSDGRCRGLFADRLPNGDTYWRLKYQEGGKWTLKTFGKYPDVTLDRARELYLVAQGALVQGFHLKETFNKLENKEEIKVDESKTLESIFKLWIIEREAKKRNKNQKCDTVTVSGRFNNHIFPKWRKRNIESIDTLEAEELLKTIYSKVPETSHKTYQYLREVWRYAIKNKIINTPNIFDIIKIGEDVGSLDKSKHYPAITDPEELGILLNCIQNYQGGMIVKYALMLSAHCVIRSQELRFGKWSEVDWKNRKWIIPGNRMKKRVDHVIPLSSVVLKMLEELKTYTDGELMFPSPTERTRPLSDMIFPMALRRMGYKGIHNHHSFRATFRTIADETLRFPFDVIEHQMAHMVKDANGTAYNRTHKIEDRMVMMEAYSNYLESLRIKTTA